MSNTRTLAELEKAFRMELQEFENNYKEAIDYPIFEEMREMKISVLASSLRKLLIDFSKSFSCASSITFTFIF